MNKHELNNLYKNYRTVEEERKSKFKTGALINVIGLFLFILISYFANVPALLNVTFICIFLILLFICVIGMIKN